MKVTASSIENIPIVRLSGRFDAFEVPQFVQWLETHISAETSWAVVNLEGVEFIDSSGLSALVKALKRCRQHQGDLYLCHLQQAVLIIFELTRMNSAMSIFADEATAIAAIQQANRTTPEG